MSTVASKFLAELKSGNYSVAVDVLKEGLAEKNKELVAKMELDVLQSYGFKLVEQEDNSDEEDETTKDVEEENEDDEKSKSDKVNEENDDPDDEDDKSKKSKENDDSDEED